MRSESLEDRTLLSSVTVVTDFGTDGVLDLGPDAATFAVQQASSLIVATELADASGFQLQRFDAQGQLDPLFGVDGTATAEFITQGIGSPIVAVDSLGRIIVAGGAADGPLALAAFDADGTLLASFGTNGLAELQTGADLNVLAVEARDDGGVLVLFEDRTGNRVARFNDRGRIVPTFGSTGRASVPLLAEVDDMAVDAEGRILVSGRLSDSQVGVVRLGTDGRLDTTFGVNGLAAIEIDDTARRPQVGETLIAIDDAGRILVATEFDDHVRRHHDHRETEMIAVARLDADGVLDPTFGVDGIALIDVETGTTLDALTVQQDGRILLGLTDPRGDAVLLRLDTEGRLDTDFDDDGVFVLPGARITESVQLMQRADGTLMVGAVQAGTQIVTLLDVGTEVMVTDDILTFDAQTGEFLRGLSDGTELRFETVGQWDAQQDWTFVSGDFNGNGLIDVAGRDDAGQWWVGLNTAVGLQTRFWGSMPVEGFAAEHIVAGDFNGDGRTDIAGLHNNGRLFVLVSTGSRFQMQDWGPFSATGWVSLEAGDVNGDGRDDIIGLHETGQIWAAVSNGTRFENRFLAQWDANAGWQDVIVGDFDGDGRVDLAARTATGQWWTAISDPLGGRSLTRFAGTFSPNVEWTSLMTADLNADGFADILGLTETGQWWMLESTGVGFSPLFLGTNVPPTGASILSGADFTGTGVAGLSALDPATGQFFSGLIDGEGQLDFSLVGETFRTALDFFTFGNMNL